MNLVDAANAVIESADGYALERDAPDLYAAIRDLNSAVVGDLTPWTVGRPRHDRERIVIAIRENAAKPRGERLTQVQLAAVLGVSDAVVRRAGRGE